MLLLLLLLGIFSFAWEYIIKCTCDGYRYTAVIVD